MNFNKEAYVTGFALFALFFGAGNLILPPSLGFFAGYDWYFVAAGFLLSAVGLPLLGILAHAKLQGSVLSFGNKVSPLFSLIFSVTIYLISIALPAPRTASVTHEIAIAPFLNVSPWFTSVVYFLLVFLFVIKRSQVINNIGRFLTPAILLLLLAIIVNTFFLDLFPAEGRVMQLPVLKGFFEGYQTFDAIAALVVGGVIVVSVKLKGQHEAVDIKRIITTAAVLAGIALVLVYSGLIYNGALVAAEFPDDVTRTQLLSGISRLSLGGFASVALALLVTLACFTTAVGIVTGTADFLTQVIPKKGVYHITVTIACLLGVVMGALTVNTIIEIALPVLMIIYPLTIVLIVLNVLPEYLQGNLIMRAVVFITVLFSLPDALAYILPEGQSAGLFTWIPFSNYNLGWVLPSLVCFAIVAGMQRVYK